MKGKHLWIPGVALTGLILVLQWLSAEETAVSVESAPPNLFPGMLVPGHNPISPEGVALGRKLFFDPILSNGGKVSCATCHDPAKAFADGKVKSTGAIGRDTRRHAPSLVNVGYVSGGLFWDGSLPNLEAQVIRSIEDTTEMASDWTVVIRKLREDPEYGPAFVALYGLRDAGHIRPLHVARVIAQFERSLVSQDALYDRYRAGVAALSEAEMRGMAIFFDFEDDLPDGECNHCHMDPFFTDFQFMNNGIQSPEAWKSNPDAGRAEFTGKPFDRGKFRIPTLRNVALTAPYMHDGSMATLEEVIGHYNSGGHPAINSNVNVRPLGLTERDKADLLAFLHTLTDTSFIHHPDFQRP